MHSPSQTIHRKPPISKWCDYVGMYEYEGRGEDGSLDFDLEIVGDFLPENCIEVQELMILHQLELREKVGNCNALLRHYYRHYA